MFTGIVECAGRVEAIREGRKSTELYVRAQRIARSMRKGGSLAVNGACLTVVNVRKGVMRFDVLNETLRRTNFGTLKRGSLVNLERAMRADHRMDGHFVLGHVDARGKLRRYEREGKDYVLEVEAPASLMKYIIEKGSIAVDGISLTVAALGRNWLRIWIIPHTHKVTNLFTRRAGDFVNLEADVLGKYAERLLERGRGEVKWSAFLLKRGIVRQRRA
ncbi:MAG: riboflavin synthase [Verrucomicrobiae bacterium]|nr:riboflavin synthase [Verrucomicrobiae bacterium]